jgi:hypothetical protein
MIMNSSGCVLAAGYVRHSQIEKKSEKKARKTKINAC